MKPRSMNIHSSISRQNHPTSPAPAAQRHMSAHRKLISISFACLLSASLVASISACGRSVSTSPIAGVGSANANTKPNGQASANSGVAASGHVTINNCGRTLTFRSVPNHVVGMMPSQTELLLRLGAEKSLVGQAQTDVSPLPADLKAKAANIPVLSTDAPPARENLLSAKPNLVVAPTEYEFTAEQGYASIEQLKTAGSEVYVATGGCAERRNTATVADLRTDIHNLGAILDLTQVASALNSQVDERLKIVAQRIKGKPPLTVAQVFVEGNSISAIGAGVEADIIKTAGGNNVFDPKAAEFKSFFAAKINPEEIIKRQPQAIIFGTTSAAQEAGVLTFLKAIFPDVPAVKNNLLIAVPEGDLHPGTLGNVTAVETISQRLYPTN